MEAIGMIQAAAGLFAVAAVGGIVMAAIRIAAKRNPPHWLAMGHGFLAGAGLTLLIYAALTVGLPQRAMAALALFVVAAAGGDMALDKAFVGVGSLAEAVEFALPGR